MIDPSLITSVDPPPGGDHLNIQISPEEEIRVIMSDVAQQLKERFPTIYGDMTENADGEWVFTHSKV